jgi:hypothetical protein
MHSSPLSCCHETLLYGPHCTVPSKIELCSLAVQANVTICVRLITQCILYSTPLYFTLLYSTLLYASQLAGGRADDGEIEDDDEDEDDDREAEERLLSPPGESVDPPARHCVRSPVDSEN